MKILGINVDEVSRQEVIGKISGWVRPSYAQSLPAGRHSYGEARHVVTIYSEFFLAAEKDKKFIEAIKRADLVVPDGVGVLAAMEYQRKVADLSSTSEQTFTLFRSVPMRKTVLGLNVGLKGLRGGLGKPVTGVWLFEELVRLATMKGWKVFLLGGFGETAERLAEKLRVNVKGRTLDIEFDAGEQKVLHQVVQSKANEKIIKKINRFKPDILFVAYGPIKQEKWICENKKKLKVKVAIGVGGTFDEVLGEFPKAPKWMERRGLKALWRLIIQPKRLLRVWRAMVVFPWKVWREQTTGH